MDNKTLKRAIEEYGTLTQIIVAIEEMAELTKELCKQLRGRDNMEEIAEEIADVEIVLAEQKMLFDCAEMVKEFEAAKIRRLRERLEGKHEQTRE